MRFAFSEDQQWLKTSAKRFCQENSALEALKVGQISENPADIWSQVAQELGWSALIIPEAYGGAGMGFVELAALIEEVGRYLIPSPFFSTVCLGANALIRGGSEEQKQTYLPKIATGELTATLAYLESSNDTDPAAIEMIAKSNGEQFELNGTKTFVLDGHTADLLIISARLEDQINIELFAIKSDTPGIRRELLPNMDQTRCLAKIELDQVQIPKSAMLNGQTTSTNLLGEVLNHAAIALAAEQVGGAEQCLDMAVAYAKERHQFGQPIGSFQAIKHKCADMLVQVESARSAAYYAAWAADHAPDELSSAAAMAKVYCSEAYFDCASENIQVHGGIGFTWEHQAHRYFKRAQADEMFLGSPDQYRNIVAQEIGL